MDGGFSHPWREVLVGRHVAQDDRLTGTDRGSGRTEAVRTGRPVDIDRFDVVRVSATCCELFDTAFGTVDATRVPCELVATLIDCRLAHLDKEVCFVFRANEHLASGRERV